MSLSTLRNMQNYYYNEEMAMLAAAETDQKRREQVTPAEKLPGAVDALFNKIVAAMPGSLNVRPPYSTDRGFGFRIDLRELGAFGTTNDVIAGIIAKFEAIGFKCRHSFNVGVNTFDWVTLTAPADWLQRLLVPIVNNTNE